MYHIKADKRSQASALLLCSALTRLLRKKSFDEVTISDLQRESGVSRSTFYRCFDRMEDVLALMCDRVFAEAFESNADNISRAVFCAWYRHSDVIQTVVSIRRSDILYDSLRRSADALYKNLLDSEDRGVYDYMVSIIVSTMLGIMIAWVERGMTESEEELAQIILLCFKSMQYIGL